MILASYRESMSRQRRINAFWCEITPKALVSILVPIAAASLGNWLDNVWLICVTAFRGGPH